MDRHLTLLTRAGALGSPETPTAATGPEVRPLGFDGTLDDAPFACVRLNDRGVITAANLAACSLLMIRPSRRVRPVMSAFVSPPEMRKFFGFLQQLERSDVEIRTRLEMRSPSGRQWWCDCIGRPDRDGTSLVSLSDVSEQHRSIEDLRVSEERTRALIESLPDAVFVVQEGLVVEANQAAESLVGRRPLGEPFASFVGAHQSSLVAARLATRHCEALERHELAFLPNPRDTSARVIETTWLPITLGGKHATVCVARDRTVERETDARTAQRDRLATAGVLAAGVAHELNNPLTYVTMNLDELTRELSALPAQTAELMALAEGARDGAQRMTRIVADLRGLASVEERQEPVDLNKVAERSLSLMAAHLRGRIDVVSDLGKLVPVRGNDGQLTQVVSNLLLNAVQAMDESAGRIVVSTAASRDRVLLTVSDTGPGVPSEIADQLFEPFITRQGRWERNRAGFVRVQPLRAGLRRGHFVAQPGGGRR